MGSSALLVARERLLAHLAALEGERHPVQSPAQLERAQRYIADHWRSCGLRVTSDEFSYMGGSAVNLLAQPQEPPPGPRLILGAHVDTVAGTPGADDNASGIAALLEVARVIAALPQPPAVELAAFTLEEEGLLGSRHYAAALRRAGVPLLGMLSLEMIAFTETRGCSATHGSCAACFPRTAPMWGWPAMPARAASWIR